MAFVIGARSNSPQLKADASLISTAKHAVANESMVSVLDTGGDPTIAFQGSLASTAKNASGQEAEREELTQKLLDSLGQVVAAAPEANPLEALNRAADANRAAGSTGTIVIADSGVQTEGAFSHGTPGQLYADPEDLARNLQSQGHLPDLSGMTVILSGIGYVSDPQGSLDASTRRNIQDQWTSIATTAGAACVGVDTNPRSGSSVAGAPTVTPVPVKQPIGVPEAGKPVILRSEVRFLPNSDELREPDQAKELLSPLAASLVQRESKVMLTGTTATDGDSEGRLALSGMRAERVKELLVALGVNAARITTRGVGTNHPGHVPDLDSNGNLLPGPAAMNRSVIVSVS